MKIIEEKYSNNQLKHRWIYLNGKRFSLECWYFNGQLKNKFNLFGSQYHGLQESWYESSYPEYRKQEYKENYINNERHGPQIYHRNITTYYKYGTQITKEEYEKYIKSIEKGILNILSIDKNTLNLTISRYLI